MPANLILAWLAVLTMLINLVMYTQSLINQQVAWQLALADQPCQIPTMPNVLASLPIVNVAGGCRKTESHSLFR